MGCDIHMYAEVKAANEWRAVGRVFKDDYHQAEIPATIYWYDDEGEYEHNKAYTVHPYDNRNYELFSILADVRNSERIKPIACPRGMPHDVSSFVRNEIAKYGSSGHSHSWLSLQELEAYPWDEMITCHGVVSQKEYEKFKRQGRPDSWSGGVVGGKVVMVDNEDMERIIKFGNALSTDYVHRYYTSIEWQWNVSQVTDNFSKTTIPALRELLSKQGVEDVRIVFFFDN